MSRQLARKLLLVGETAPNRSIFANLGKWPARVCLDAEVLFAGGSWPKYRNPARVAA